MAQPTPSFHLSDFENLQEDLVLLQTSLEQHRVDPLRAQVQCADILSAVAEVSEEQEFLEYGKFVLRLAEFVHDTPQPQESLGPEFWSLTLDVLDELLAALEMADAGLKIDQKAMKRHIVAFDKRLHALTESESAPEAAAAPAQAPATEGEAPDQQEISFTPVPQQAPAPAADGDGAVETADDRKARAPANLATDEPQQLLERATEAARAGRHDEAQRLAAAAAVSLAEHSRRQKEAELGGLRESLKQVEAGQQAAKAELEQTRTALEEHQSSLQEARTAQDEAQTLFENHAKSLEHVKQELEEVEQRLAQLQSSQQELTDQFEDALRQKDEAERLLQQARAEAEAREVSLRSADERQRELAAGVERLDAQQAELQDRIEALEHDLES